jgi:cytochrome b subunit of formate dehydrogenase
VLTEYYSKISTYLTQTFGVEAVYLTIIVTTFISLLYLIIISYLITHLDKHYFVLKSINNVKTVNDKHRGNIQSVGSITKIKRLMSSVKVLIGIFLIVCGLAMLVLPGQGVVTIIIGLSLVPFPGKQKLMKNLLSRQSVRSTLNWIRMKAKKEPFVFEGMAPKKPANNKIS